MARKLIYVPVEKEDMWQRFKKACERDGTTMSQVIVKKVSEWMVTHEPGNPQTAINSFSEGGKATLAGIEGRVRQLCLERIAKAGDMTLKEVREIAKVEGVKGSQLKPFIDRVTQWLKEQGKKVWR